MHVDFFHATKYSKRRETLKYMREFTQEISLTSANIAINPSLHSATTKIMKGDISKKSKLLLISIIISFNIDLTNA